MVFCLLLHGPLTSVEASDLKPPLPLSTEVVDEPPLGPGCTLPAAGPLQKSLLIVRNTPRIVGPYTVKLPGYATDPNDTAHDSYRPFLIRAKLKDSLRVDLANQLPVVTTNDGDGRSLDPLTPAHRDRGRTGGTRLGAKVRTAFCGTPPADFTSNVDPPLKTTWIGSSQKHVASQIIFPAINYWRY